MRVQFDVYDDNGELMGTGITVGTAKKGKIYPPTPIVRINVIKPGWAVKCTAYIPDIDSYSNIKIVPSDGEVQLDDPLSLRFKGPMITFT